MNLDIFLPEDDDCAGFFITQTSREIEKDNVEKSDGDIYLELQQMISVHPWCL